jgi:hypothetical protein
VEIRAFSVNSAVPFRSSSAALEKGEDPPPFFGGGCNWVSFPELEEEEFVMTRSTIAAFAFAIGALFLLDQPASAQMFTLLFNDDFETFQRGSLNKNDPTGPNQAPNGSGNPWFGPFPPNQQVVGAEGGVIPYSGSQMVRGENTGSGTFDQSWYNLAYRLNNGLPFSGLVLLDWYFYDPLGPGGTDFRDYVALGFYDTAPPDTDGPFYGPGNPDNYDLNFGVGLIQRLSLGATFHTDPGYDPNYYQARVVGASDGYNSNGWFNTQTPRTVGWHHAAIAAGPQRGDGTNKIFFFIDDASHATLVHNSVLTYGYNVIELNQNFGIVTGYFDDVSFSTIRLH